MTGSYRNFILHEIFISDPLEIAQTLIFLAWIVWDNLIDQVISSNGRTNVDHFRRKYGQFSINEEVNTFYVRNIKEEIYEICSPSFSPFLSAPNSNERFVSLEEI